VVVTTSRCIIFWVMAKDKKSFLLYCDIIHTVEKMPTEKAGKLFKHILQYVNDQDPITDDIIVQLTFEPIKQQLKRDLRKYEDFIEKQRENGKRGGRPPKPTETQKTQAFLKKPKKADIDTDIDKEKERKKEKRKFKPPTRDEVINYFITQGYSKNLGAKAFDYYTIQGWKDAWGKPVKNWKAKMIAVWFREEDKEKNGIITAAAIIDSMRK
jgi:hypothetical protein